MYQSKMFLLLECSMYVILFCTIILLVICVLTYKTKIARLEAENKAKTDTINNLNIQVAKLQTKLECNKVDNNIPIIIVIEYNKYKEYLINVLKDIGHTLDDKSQKYLEKRILNDSNRMGFKTTRRSDDGCRNN